MILEKRNGFAKNVTIRIFPVPNKTLPKLNQDILHQILVSLLDLIPSNDGNIRQRRHEAVTRLCLTCREWRDVARLYLPLELLEIKQVFPRLIGKISFVKRRLEFSDGEQREFTMKAWRKDGQLFLDVYSRIPPGTSHLTQIEFDGCFRNFRPSEWSYSFRRCSHLQSFWFAGEACVWDDVRDFLIGFQTSSRVIFKNLYLAGISILKRNNVDCIATLQASQKLRLKQLAVGLIPFTDISSDILPVVISDLAILWLYKTSFDVDCARETLNFLSSTASTTLKVVTCSLMPPCPKEFFSSPQPEHTLIWPLSLALPLQGIFSYSSLKSFDFDGGVYGATVITHRHIEMFSLLPALKSLRLEYCLNDVHPTRLDSLTDAKRWPFLRQLDITFAFGDPNWEKGDIDQLVRQLRLGAFISLNEGPDKLSIGILLKKSQSEVRLSRLIIREGGDKIDA
jgi:hypothetical protein